MDQSSSCSLRVYLFGPPRIIQAGQSLSIPRRQTRALLYRLAADLKPVSREQLAFLLWPDIPNGEARRKLSHLLSHLRQVLSAPEILHIRQEYASLNPAATWSDTSAFQQLILETGISSYSGRGKPARPSSLAQHEAILQATRLYSGPFLDGFSLPGCPEFELWVAEERSAYERRYLAALLELIRFYAEQSAFGEAIACAQRYLAVDSLAEEVHRSLIEFHSRLGDFSAAQHQFELCASILERELGVSPLPETWSVYRAAIEGRASGAKPLSPAPERKSPLPYDIPLIGREKILSDLEQHLEQARSGQSQVVMISGEAGIGKTRLLSAFCSKQGPRVNLLVGGCSPGVRTVPYHPILEALRPAVINPAALDNLQPVWLAELSRLLPELRIRCANLPVPLPVEAEEARVRLFEALYRFIRQLADGPYPVLLCLDDLHWADPITLEWLAFLGARLAGGKTGQGGAARILVAGAYRSDEASGLGELRLTLSRFGLLREYRLDGLNVPGVLELLRHVPGTHRLEPSVAAELHRITGGNYFFILEILRALDETGRFPLQSQDLKDLPLPDSIREAIQQRLARLDSKARQVLEAAAVIGPCFTFDLVQDAAGRSELETLDSLENLAGSGFLAEREGKYQFCHDLIRTVLYSELRAWRRRRLHLRVGEALQKVSSQDAAGLAWHYEQAGRLGTAAGFSLQSGIEASKVFAYQQARACFDHALELLAAELPSLSTSQEVAANQRLQGQILSWRGWVFRLLGEMRAYEKDLQEESRLAGILNDTAALASVKFRQAAAHRWYCRYDEAQASAEECLALCLEAGDIALQAKAYREIGMALRSRGCFAEARTALERALALFQRVDEPLLEVHTLGNLSTLHGYLGEHSKAFSLAEQALERCEGSGLAYDRRIPLGDLGAAQAALGFVADARRNLLESLEISRQIADRTQEIFCLGHLGWLALGSGEVELARQKLQSALALAEGIDSRAEQSWLHAGLAESYLLAGERSRAASHTRTALELAQAFGRTYDERLALRVLEKLKAG